MSSHTVLPPLHSLVAGIHALRLPMLQSPWVSCRLDPPGGSPFAATSLCLRNLNQHSADSRRTYVYTCDPHRGRERERERERERGGSRRWIEDDRRRRRRYECWHDENRMDLYWPSRTERKKKTLNSRARSLGKSHRKMSKLVRMLSTIRSLSSTATPGQLRSARYLRISRNSSGFTDDADFA